MPLNNNSNKQFVEREPIDIDAIVVSSSSAPLSLQEIDARICAVNAAINAAHGTVVGGNSAAITKLTAALATLQTLKIQTEVAVAETQELALKEQQAAEATAAAAKIVLMDYKNNICYVGPAAKEPVIVDIGRLNREEKFMTTVFGANGAPTKVPVININLLPPLEGQPPAGKLIIAPTEATKGMPFAAELQFPEMKAACRDGELQAPEGVLIVNFEKSTFVTKEFTVKNEKNAQGGIKDSIHFLDAKGTVRVFSQTNTKQHMVFKVANVPFSALERNVEALQSMLKNHIEALEKGEIKPGTIEEMLKQIEADRTKEKNIKKAHAPSNNRKPEHATSAVEAFHGITLMPSFMQSLSQRTTTVSASADGVFSVAQKTTRFEAAFNATSIIGNGTVPVADLFTPETSPKSSPPKPAAPKPQKTT